LRGTFVAKALISRRVAAAKGVPRRKRHAVRALDTRFALLGLTVMGKR